MKSAQQHTKDDVLAVLEEPQKRWIDEHASRKSDVSDMTVLVARVKAVMLVRAAEAANNRAMLTVNVLEASDSQLRGLGPEGEEMFPLRPGALGALRLARGDTVALDCTLDAAGAPTVERVLPQQGLPIHNGTVLTYAGSTLVIDGPLGVHTFVTNAWTDLPEGLVVGDYLGVKHYGMDGARAVLNARRFPGLVEDTGVVTALSPLSVRTLNGEKRFEVKTLPAGIAVDSSVTVQSHRDGAKRTVQAIVPRDELVFVGKMSSYDPITHDFTMVDAWGGVLGLVHLRLDAGCGPECGIVPGDLVEVRYTYGPDGTPSIHTLKERPLSPVYFGRIDAIDSARVRMTTLQQQPKELEIAADTRQPLPIGVGDLADVVYRPREGALPLALLIVKE